MTETLVQNFAILIDFKVPAAKATCSSTIISSWWVSVSVFGRWAVVTLWFFGSSEICGSSSSPSPFHLFHPSPMGSKTSLFSATMTRSMPERPQRWGMDLLEPASTSNRSLKNIWLALSSMWASPKATLETWTGWPMPWRTLNTTQSFSFILAMVVRLALVRVSGCRVERLWRLRNCVTRLFLKDGSTWS